MSMKRIFISGPLTRGDPMVNIHQAVKAGSELIQRGYAPFIPHLSWFHAVIRPEHDYETWLAWCLTWVAACHAVLRLPGMSAGADREVAEAKRLAIPVFYTLEDLEKHFGKDTE